MTLKCVRCDKKFHISDAEYVYYGQSLCEEHYREIKDLEKKQADKIMGFRF